MFNCIIAGVGGQGSVLMSRLIGGAAIEKGLFVRGTETIGMAQRGGSVVSHVRMGDGIHSPLIPQGKADVLIAFEPGEAVRALPYLSPRGALVACDRAVPPVTSALREDGYEAAPMLAFLREHVQRLTVVDGEALIRDLGSARVMNVALLGVALSLSLFPFSQEEVRAVMERRLPARFLDLNLAALAYGARLPHMQKGGTLS